MKITGNCKQCGQCCKDISLDVWGVTETSILETDINKRLKNAIGEWVIANPYFDFTKVKKIIITDESIHVQGVNCRALVKKNGKYFCKIHKNRPQLCKDYPNENTTLFFKGCGFKVKR